MCFSPGALALLGAIWLVLQGVIVFLFRGWFGALNQQIAAEHANVMEARSERDRVTDSLEATIGLGEKAVRRSGQRRSPP